MSHQSSIHHWSVVAEGARITVDANLPVSWEGFVSVDVTAFEPEYLTVLKTYLSREKAKELRDALTEALYEFEVECRHCDNEADTFIDGHPYCPGHAAAVSDAENAAVESERAS